MGTALNYENFNTVYHIKGIDVDSIKKVEYDKMYPSYIMKSNLLKGVY